MPGPVPDIDEALAAREERRSRRRERHRQRMLVATSALPSLCTLGNAVSGFAAIHFATKPLSPGVLAAGDLALAFVGRNLVIGAWLIFAAMVFDALDGRLARLTRKTSDFGGQLDSLCDAVSFGVAPAVLMLRAVQGVLRGDVGEVDPIGPQVAIWGKAIWVIAALYVCCAILRLARFNVENEPDESAHMSFKGLPSPAAALAVVSLVLLYEHVNSISVDGWRASPWMARTVVWAMPVVTLAAALLMVSRMRYVHVINQYVRGRRPFGYLVKLVLVVFASVVIGFQVTLAAVALLYLLAGPTHELLHRRRARAAASRPAAEEQAP